MSKYGFLPRKSKFGTKTVHSGCEPEQWESWITVPPIYVGVTFKHEAPGKLHNGYTYSRIGNPTRSALEKSLASVEEAEYALTFASGTAAVVTVTHLLNAGDDILVVDELYGGTFKYFTNIANRMNISIRFINALDLEMVKNSIKPNTKMMFLESPSNPLLKIVDISEISKIVHNISKDIIVVVDNTFMTAYFQKPLDLGADVSMYSLTKYYNGHSDVIMGALVMQREDLYKRLKYLQKGLGAIPSPHDCYSVLRSIKTLPLRMEKHMKNGIAVARYLEQHPRIDKVLHPVLESHEQYHLARQQSYGHSGMLAFFLKGDEIQTKKFIQNLKIFTMAGSLGDAGSLVSIPLIMIDLPEHQNQDKDFGRLVRMSVGLEDAEDLIDDLDHALKVAFN